MFCHKCGTQVNPGVQFCPNCGESMSSPLSSGTAVGVPWTPPTGIKAAPGKWIGQGWALVKQDMVNFAIAALLFSLISGAVPLILQGAMTAGFHIYIMRKLLGRNADFGDLFKGFNFFIPTLIATILISVFVSIGTLLCIIPGLIVAAMYKFTYLFMVDKRMDFWPAMQASHAVVKNDYFGFTMFIVLAVLVNILGFLCCIIGIFVTIPLTLAAITIAYQELVGFDPATTAAL